MRCGRPSATPAWISSIPTIWLALRPSSTSQNHERLGARQAAAGTLCFECPRRLRSPAAATGDASPATVSLPLERRKRNGGAPCTHRRPRNGGLSGRAAHRPWRPARGLGAGLARLLATSLASCVPRADLSVRRCRYRPLDIGSQWLAPALPARFRFCADRAARGAADLRDEPAPGARPRYALARRVRRAALARHALDHRRGHLPPRPLYGLVTDCPVPL